MTTCETCGEESEDSWRCSECGADLAARGKDNATRMEGRS